MILIIIIALIIISAFFSGSETGLTAIPNPVIHKLDKENHKKAGMVKRLRDDSEGLIGTILLGNNAVNIAASALTTSLFIEWFGENGVAYATLVMTLIVLIFAEVLPKTYAIQRPESVAFTVAPIFIVLVKIFSPITKTIQKLVNFAFKIFGYDPTNKKPLLSATDSIRGAIEEQHSEGNVEKHHKDMLAGVLDLEEIEVEEVFTHRKDVISIDGGLSMSEILANVVDANHTRFPVWKDNPENIIGVLHTKTLLRKIQENGGYEALQIDEVIEDAWFIPETTLLSDQLKAFLARKQKMAIAVDEYGALQGLISLEDIIEEIVGEIQEPEEIEEEIEITKTTDGSYIISGSATIRDINRYFDWNLNDEEATTIAGLLNNTAEKIPDVGEKFTISDVDFEVLSLDNNHIDKVLVSKDLVEE